MSILQVNGAEITAPKTCKIGISDQDYNSDTDSFSCENAYVYEFELEGNEDIFCNKIEQRTWTYGNRRKRIKTN